MGVQVNYISEVKMGHRTTKTNHKVKVHKIASCRIDFFYYAFRNVLLVSVPLLVVCRIVLSHLSFHSSAYSSSTDSVSLSLPTSCTISAMLYIYYIAQCTGRRDRDSKTICTTT